MLSDEQIANCKAILLQRQGTLIEQVQNDFGMELSYIDATGELSSYDNHPADMGTELFERGKDVALNEHAENELEQINEAIHAIENGTYGICRECSMDIPYDRLLAIPTTDKCIEHAENDDSYKSRPVEEEVYSAQLNPGNFADKEQVGYDSEDAWQDVSRYGTSETPSDLYGDQESYNEMYPNSDENVGIVEDVEKYSSHYANDDS